jgi:hypothetical protein
MFFFGEYLESHERFKCDMGAEMHAFIWVGAIFVRLLAELKRAGKL